MKKTLVMAAVVLLTACSTTKTVTQSKVDIYKSLNPPSGKAIVYIIRPNAMGLIVPFKVFCNDSLIGSTTGNKYLFAILEPGKNHFLSDAENKSELELQTEPNKIYFLEQKVKMGLISARNQLVRLNEEEGRAGLAKCNLSSKFSPPEL